MPFIPSPGMPAGAGGSPTDAKYVTTALNATLSAETAIPGLAGSPDKAAGGVDDDEFDTTSSAPPTGWTAVGTPSVSNENTDVLSHYHVRATAASGTALHGIRKACPAIPFTVTAALVDFKVDAANNRVCLGIAEAAPGAYSCLMVENVGAGLYTLEAAKFTSRTAYGANIPTNLTNSFLRPPLFLRIVVTLSTNVAYQWSFGGLIWHTHASGDNPGYTVGSVFLGVDGDNASSADPEAFFDWIRFT